VASSGNWSRPRRSTSMATRDRARRSCRMGKRLLHRDRHHCPVQLACHWEGMTWSSRRLRRSPVRRGLLCVLALVLSSQSTPVARHSGRHVAVANAACRGPGRRTDGECPQAHVPPLPAQGARRTGWPSRPCFTRRPGSLASTPAWWLGVPGARAASTSRRCHRRARSASCRWSRPRRRAPARDYFTEASIFA
jgi:hypothetical protein